MIVLIGVFDELTGYQISLFVLYSFPIAIVAWRMGLGAGLVFALLGTITTRVADVLNHRPYAASWIPWEVMANRFIILAFIAVSFDRFQRTQQRDQDRLKDLEAVAPMCSVCHRIKVEDGDWIDFEAQVQRQRAEPNRRLCTDCAKVKYVSDLTL
jgi:hypothetical protein